MDDLNEWLSFLQKKIKLPGEYNRDGLNGWVDVRFMNLNADPFKDCTEQEMLDELILCDVTVSYHTIAEDIQNNTTSTLADKLANMRDGANNRRKALSKIHGGVFPQEEYDSRRAALHMQFLLEQMDKCSEGMNKLETHMPAIKSSELGGLALDDNDTTGNRSNYTDTGRE